MVTSDRSGSGQPNGVFNCNDKSSGRTGQSYRMALNVRTLRVGVQIDGGTGGQGPLLECTGDPKRHRVWHTGSDPDVARLDVDHVRVSAQISRLQSARVARSPLQGEPISIRLLLPSAVIDKQVNIRAGEHTSALHPALTVHHWRYLCLPS